ncbi:MAG: DNA helicase RecQ [Dehalococcoidia bacterium]|nr:DNA helicase RecQ [Dehalococcoidia bacterium]
MQEPSGANSRLADVLKQRFGHEGFLPMQEEVIENVLARRDSLVLMPTGSGKSVCYQLPALLLDGVTLVVSPLIALMKDQVDSLKSKGIRAAFVNSTMTYSDVRTVQADAYRGRLDILYVSPERLTTQRFNDFLSALKLGLIAIDEAHCISEWGHDFRPDYRNLQTLRNDFPDTPVIALTATATERVREDILQHLRMPGASRFVASFNRPNLTYEVRPKRKSFQVLVDLLGRRADGSAIVYRFSRQETEDLASRLAGRGFRALPYHAGLEDDVRRETQERFLSDEVPIIVATIAFGMGVDKPNIRLVVHYDLPKTIEGYYQETGRAGRDGRPSDCVLFFSYGDRMKQEFFIGQIEDDLKRANAEAKLAKMVEYGNTTSCRRRFLLDYFGEEWSKDNCGACDVCLAEERRVGPDSTFDGTEAAQKVLSAVVRTGERFGANHVVDVLRGSRSSRVLELRHDHLSVYGIAREMQADDLKDVIDQLIGMGLIERASGEFPTLSVTPRGRQLLKDREPVTLVRQVVGPAPEGDPAAAHDEVLFQKLRVLRKELADTLGVPAFFVFSDATLRQLASNMPGDRDQMLKVKGVGDSKLRQFGDRFLSVIAGHLAGTGDKSAHTP